MAPLFLTEVRRQAERRAFRLTWSDGHSAELDYDYVRGYCPCAGCQGHGSGRIAFHRPPKPVTPTTVEPVGHYAISVLWSDGHATGIYSFGLLRRICPCEACLGGPPPDDPPDVAAA